MLSTTRSRTIFAVSRVIRFPTRRSYAFNAQDKQEVNVGAAPKKDVPNISKTNEQYPIETHFQDAPLQETTTDAEELRVSQAPNRTSVWSRSQSPRSKAMSGPRFEQTIMEFQVGIYNDVSITTADTI